MTLGCDFNLSYEKLQDVFVRPQGYTIAGTGYLLVEFSNYSIPQQISVPLQRLIDIDRTPILTHPERNPLLQHDVPRILRWIENGCLVQVTADSLTGKWGESALRSVRTLLEQKAVHAVATDAHDTRRRIPVLSTARDLLA